MSLSPTIVSRCSAIVFCDARRRYPACGIERDWRTTNPLSLDPIRSVVGYFESCFGFGRASFSRFCFLSKSSLISCTSLNSLSGVLFDRYQSSQFHPTLSIFTHPCGSFRPPLLVGFPESNQFFHAPQPIRDARSHRGRRAECTMNLDEIVCEIIQRHRSGMILQFARESI